MLAVIFVWPTLYRYEHSNLGLGTIRINRLTSSAARLTLNGWQELSEQPVAAAPPAPSAPVQAVPQPVAVEPPRPVARHTPKTDEEIHDEIDRIMSRR
jgi:hypothetical protein